MARLRLRRLMVYAADGMMLHPPRVDDRRPAPARGGDGHSRHAARLGRRRPQAAAVPSDNARAPAACADTAPARGTPSRRRDWAQWHFLIVLAALCFLMFVAYRGYSVILFAPVAALRRGAADRSGAGAADVHRPVHGQDGRLPQAVFPGVPARRGVRQADRAVGLLASRSSPRSSASSAAARDAVDRAGRARC